MFDAQQRQIGADAHHHQGNRAGAEQRQPFRFGGGNMGFNQSAIGAQNIEFVEEFLAREGLLPVARCLGGGAARKVIYEPGTGRVRLLRLPPLEQRAVEREEQILESTITRQPVEAGSIELFD